ncbi:MAG TPA: 6-pyruvoyl-tetrahydropterin synthase-related protein [Acidimicrobiales bacterium]|nr:6-pyruvoyl-tetrahydropterin synthase-related protein [Acidimicrobiales bacterium]
MRRPSAPSIVTFGAVAGVIGVVLWQLHPALLLQNSTLTGGDTGAHVGLAGFLRSNLMPAHVTGWDPGAYDGFPLNTFYFPLPDFLAVAFSYVIPFNIAFKLMTVLGSLLLPVAAWLFGRLAGLERPRPAVLAIATLPFLFDQSYTIYGGNLYSTMAGEYAFSLGLAAALIFLGLAVRGMRTGRFRAAAAVVLALCILCHLLTAFFALFGALVIFLLAGPTRKRFWWMLSSVGGGLLLISWWLVPFVADRAYSTSMGWQNVSPTVSLFVPQGNIWVVVLAGLGTLVAIVVAITRRQSAPLLLAVLATTAALVVRFDPQWQLYNVRFLPFWTFSIYLLAGYFVAEAGVALAQAVRRLRLALWRDAVVAARTQSAEPAPVGPAGPPTTAGPGPDLDGGRSAEPASLPVPGGSPPASAVSWPRPRLGPWAPGSIAVPVLAMLGALLVVVTPLVPRLDTDMGSLLHHQFSPSSVASWADWNYSGYQAKPAWKELNNGIIDTTDRVAHTYGCGRMMWEYNANENRFGTPEALMLMPYWTGNCIDSMEGVLFESASTTPYHFLNQAELSAQPSEAVVAATTHLQYGSLDVALGVQHLQLLGVKYFMASTPSVQAEADADPALTLVATTGPWSSAYQGQTIVTTWKFYEVHDAPLVAPLTKTPDVLTGVAAGQSTWLPSSQTWYADPTGWSQQLVVGGEPSWLRTKSTAKPPTGKALPAVRVTDVKMGINTLSFHVDRTGVPVEVRISYFPNWQATGAKGPWRAEPNLMVLDPTSKNVTLRYGSTGADHLGLLLSIIGVLLLIVMVRRRSFSAAWSPLSNLARRRPR